MMNEPGRGRPDLTNFSQNLLGWNCKLPGRGLPWAFSGDPYRIWISEIMLQQTQARTVVAYFERFITEFPDVVSLANAPSDDVMTLWAGLGYYTRARNLHAAAKIVRDHHRGQFPRTFQEVVALPGVGKSTAGAICALAYGMRTPILDGNAKRVYARYHCVNDESESARNRRLWEIAEQNTPEQNVQRYTQLIMDLGATICTPRNPQCPTCPVRDACCAYSNNLTDQLPRRKTPVSRDVRHVTMLIITDDGDRVVLQRRPPEGIWGDLWSFPEYTGATEDVESWCQTQFGMQAKAALPWNRFNHDFTHFRLTITPQPLRLLSHEEGFLKECKLKLFEISHAQSIGIPAPVHTLLTLIQDGLTNIESPSL